MMQKTKTYSYFLGCLTPNRYPGVEAATIKVLKQFGIETIEMKGASCCPAPGVFGSFDLNTWMTIAARNITIAESSNVQIGNGNIQAETITIGGIITAIDKSDASDRITLLIPKVVCI